MCEGRSARLSGRRREEKDSLVRLRCQSQKRNAVAAQYGFSVVELALCAVRAGLNEKQRSAHNAGVFDEDIQTERSLALLFCLGKLPSLECAGLQQIIPFQPRLGS